MAPARYNCFNFISMQGGNHSSLLSPLSTCPSPWWSPLPMLWAHTAKTERKKVELWGPAMPELELPLRDLQCSVITNCLLSRKKGCITLQITNPCFAFYVFLFYSLLIGNQ